MGEELKGSGEVRVVALGVLVLANLLAEEESHQKVRVGGAGVRGLS